jgi:catechol 2,3-dioxygenase-like lactoylglutathione lyase family enzyme
MSTASLNHVGLRTAKLEETRQFFEDVVGLKAGARPPFPFPGYWLYQDGSAVIHLLGLDDSGGLEAYLGPRSQSSAGGSVDHVAFACTGYHEVRQRIERLGLEFQERVVPLTGQRQFFVNDPNGVTVELNFAAAELTSEEPATAGARSA